ncbi:endo-1,4-beta-xylanase [Parvularcula flava]|uniref:Beta-xylanase n=1 Tax=Aquisalinus luteolus TaxID=1566827 RepID=A0A8J3EQ84_9PROT|nr:endo-1,4-beta-xylanase [Aquisalinus luteolus]NHK26918.1 endo-1,4-beta-xylanase [Aquisalinus luteolus]GGH93809.1 beta-xylanase [Aquisalinus luteolus]
MTRWSRREYLTYSLGTAAMAGAGALSPAFAASNEASSLAAIAAEKGIRFGTAMAAYQVNDPKYVEIVLNECNTIVAENEHKWYTIHPQPDVWNFAPGDTLVNFAKANNLMMRGHTLIWHHPQWFPDWVNNKQFSNAAEAEAMLDDYIDRVATHYSPYLYSWDVVNETIDPETGELRETSFSRAMGPEVIDYCFHRAREYAPNATLAYNDYMSWESGHEKHRTGVLKLLERLVANGAPIQALGIQSHSNDNNPDEFTADKQRTWRAFVEEAIGMGLEIYITEFDVNDTEMDPDPAVRDEIMAAYTKDYFDLMLSYEATKEILIWGMVDKYSWLQGFKPREDGVAKRPTLYDADYKAKAMRDAVGQSLKAAPVRDPGKADPLRGKSEG